MHKYFIFFLIFFLNNLPAKELSDCFSHTEEWQRAHIGIYILDLNTQKPIYQKNAEQFFIPASLVKIPISTAAVALLGEDYCFTTSLEYEGSIHEKMLEGNLWIRGGGDPTVSLAHLSQWETDLKSLITKINGTLFVDTSCFETALASEYWSFQDLGNYYGAGASGLTLNQNTYHITFQPGEKEHDPATVIKIDPSIPNLTFYNEVTTGPAGSGDQVYVFGSEYSPIQFYRGTIPIDQSTFTIKAAIPDPALLCGSLLSKQLNPTKGIQLIREKNKSIPQQTVIACYKSPPLKELLKPMNRFSINLYAEHLLKALGKGNSKQGTKCVEEFLKSLHIPSQIHDGSGLSRTNLLTPKGMVTLLSHIRNSAIYLPVYASLPESNQTGTLQFFSKISRLQAKTGSMTNIYNLAGYLTLSSKKQYAFSIFCNYYKGDVKNMKKEIALFLELLVEKLDQ